MPIASPHESRMWLGKHITFKITLQVFCLSFYSKGMTYCIMWQNQQPSKSKCCIFYSWNNDYKNSAKPLNFNCLCCVLKQQNKMQCSVKKIVSLISKNIHLLLFTWKSSEFWLQQKLQETSQTIIQRGPRSFHTSCTSSSLLFVNSFSLYS